MTAYDIVQRPERDQLGEGPFWDEAEQALFWVDIVGKRVHRFDPSSGEVQRWTTPLHVSGAVPTNQGDLVVAMVDGLYRLDRRTGATTLFAQPDADLGNRSNEFRTDRHGRIWLGTMSNNLDKDGAGLPIARSSGRVFCVRPDGGSVQIAERVGITNTFCWSPDDTRFYTADSLTGEIWVHDYDAQGPAVSNPRLFARGDPGGPDGSAMDEEGVPVERALGGARVIRYAPDGRVDREIMLPIAQPSSCAFGGPDRKTLYVTSARQELEGLAPDSLDGSVFAVQVDVAGLPMARFGG